jgi:hypothetical protein
VARHDRTLGHAPAHRRLATRSVDTTRPPGRGDDHTGTAPVPELTTAGKIVNGPGRPSSSTSARPAPSAWRAPGSAPWACPPLPIAVAVSGRPFDTEQADQLALEDSAVLAPPLGPDEPPDPPWPPPAKAELAAPPPYQRSADSHGRDRYSSWFSASRSSQWIITARRRLATSSTTRAHLRDPAPANAPMVHCCPPKKIAEESVAHGSDWQAVRQKGGRESGGVAAETEEAGRG